MRELSLILPGDVWLTNLTGTASPEVAAEGGASVALRGSIAGPALEMVGCARSQEAVAGFVQALKDIDGVTRVGVPVLGARRGVERESRHAPRPATCQTRDFIAQFQMVVAFDAAPVQRRSRRRRSRRRKRSRHAGEPTKPPSEARRLR